jgi:GNAT superfamily N-acetyltransferase
MDRDVSPKLAWIHENPAYWDPPKAGIVGDAPPGVFDARFARATLGDLMPGDWWRVESAGEVVGYGWMDVTWGDAEILVAVAPRVRKRGIGTFILNGLEREARLRGLNYLYNVVQPSHPQHVEVHAWLRARSFMASEDGRLMRAVIRPEIRVAL